MSPHLFVFIFGIISSLKTWRKPCCVEFAQARRHAGQCIYRELDDAHFHLHNLTLAGIMFSSFRWWWWWWTTLTFQSISARELKCTATNGTTFYFWRSAQPVSFDLLPFFSAAVLPFWCLFMANGRPSHDLAMGP